MPGKKGPRDELSVPSSVRVTLSPSTSVSSYREQSPSTRSATEARTFFPPTDTPGELSDTDLYHHYLQHTSRTLTYSKNDQSALQIGIPTLALQSRTVFHSVLAASAACLACDMISRQPPAKVGAVKQALVTGYRHYHSASERMRESMSSLDTLKLEPLLASALMLVPFATASQQINHWLSENEGVEEARKPLSSTPRDIIVIMRGIRATLQTLDCESPVSGIAPSPVTDPGIDDHSILPEARTRASGIATPCNHTMGPIIASTSEEAYSKLQQRLDYAFYHWGDANDTLAACAAAFDILKDIRSNAFSRYSSESSPSSISSLDDVSQELFEPQSMSLPQVASWLRSFANRSVVPQPTEPLTRYFLTFLVQVSQAYLNLVLPLLDKRLESPAGAELDDRSIELTMEQALALDIYAHWSVLMFLVEEESWWIGNLPFVTLSGLVNRFGNNFVTRLWPEEEKGRWWPGGMLNILREIKQYR
ncbi:hypothetical protein H112_07670 [Trichophyton rubrum D6]|uniref:C6 transcription factor n=4 Tax=Trichophyton TaxID=5550 RepID=A0A178EUD4_TRIRU|nr:uncharacterized protein TERG_00268 [Trichophyton rubrum CBS 118892]EZF11255.1 hypothetical protein H100_07695 [Trichophyton rubrum MR850]EZF38120.1 hypothetical protein H102_07660 [Trichophyton rubrum CBS 100081]EZF48678.1 hypothetical protein H103_07683 [Trichophyton rubrum CBS 288.86]EZF59257.1 hypothetical protein H104_07631 [Trichophyton rubrum CBS 289.86]EZF80635.1 hypothetical protein H110_07680 [Trichophyton rubrum MR1448]EZF91339.1 hypothetical protein H113_07741 [Trichophyton rubr